jgi:hypothetical protein
MTPPSNGDGAKKKIGAFIGWLEHDPEKWVPVFRKDHAPSKLRATIVST